MHCVGSIVQPVFVNLKFWDLRTSVVVIYKNWNKIVLYFIGALGVNVWRPKEDVHWLCGIWMKVLDLSIHSLSSKWAILTELSALFM